MGRVIASLTKALIKLSMSWKAVKSKNNCRVAITSQETTNKYGNRRLFSDRQGQLVHWQADAKRLAIVWAHRIGLPGHRRPFSSTLLCFVLAAWFSVLSAELQRIEDRKSFFYHVWFGMCILSCCQLLIFSNFEKKCWIRRLLVSQMSQILVVVRKNRRVLRRHYTVVG